MEFDGLPPVPDCAEEIKYVNEIMTDLTTNSEGFKIASITIGVLAIPIFVFSVYCLIQSMRKCNNSSFFLTFYSVVVLGIVNLVFAVGYFSKAVIVT
jgi:hypothetical protein